MKGRGRGSCPFFTWYASVAAEIGQSPFHIYPILSKMQQKIDAKIIW
jgi:hypothetical protein